MNPPIPEPMSVQPTGKRGNRPATLGYLLLIESWFWIASEFLPQEPESLLETLFYNAISVAFLFLYWFLWQGRNWARVTLITLSALSFFLTLGLEALPHLVGLFDATAAADFAMEETGLERAYYFIYAAFSVVWFVWLQSSAMKSFCAKESHETQIVSA